LADLLRATAQKLGTFELSLASVEPGAPEQNANDLVAKGNGLRHVRHLFLLPPKET
jgi:hypothetical protein